MLILGYLKTDKISLSNAICKGGSVSNTHDAFFTHLETIEHLIECSGVSWQSTWLFYNLIFQNCLFIVFC